MPDNYDRWKEHDADQERRLKMLPICKCCGEHIQQERAVFYEGNWYCEDCEEIFWMENRYDFMQQTEG